VEKEEEGGGRLPPPPLPQSVGAREMKALKGGGKKKILSERETKSSYKILFDS